MAVTTPTTLATSIPMKYAQRALAKQIKGTFFDNLAGPEASGAALIQKDEVLNKPGEEITIQVTDVLSGAGVSGDTTALSGSEEAITTASLTLKTVYYRHGVRLNTRGVKKSMLDMRLEAVERLSEWGRGKLDTLRFGTAINAGFWFDASGTPGAEASGGTPYVRNVAGRAAEVNITSTDPLTLTEISKSKYILIDRGTKPFVVGGNDYFVMIVEPWVEYALKVTDTNWAAAQRDAAVRGGSNPLFTGAVGIWDGVIIRTAHRCPTNTNGASSARLARNIIFGKEAFLEAWGTKPSWAEEDFDYGIEHGFAYGFDYSCRRGLEMQSMQVRSAATKST